MKLAAAAALAACAGALYAQNEAYVVDNAPASRVVVVDLATRRLTPISTGRESSEMLILPNNRFAFVSNAISNNVVLLDLQMRQIVATIGTGGSPGSMAITPDGRTLYVADEDTNDVTVVDVASRSARAPIPVDATPVALNISPSGRFLYVVNQDELPTGTVSVIDTTQNKVVTTLSVGLKPRGFVIAPNGTTGYVMNTGSNSISVVDLTQNQVNPTPIAVGRSPVNLAIPPDGRKLYSVNRDSGNISVIDPARSAVTGQIAVGALPADMAVTSDGLFAYVTNMGSASVSILDLTSNTAEGTITVGNQPFSATFDPNEDFLFVTNLASGTVSVIDVNTDTLRSTIAVGGLPVQFEFLHAPTLTEISPSPAPAGAQLTLKGEGFVPGSAVQFVTAAPPRTLTPAVTFVNSETLLTTAPDIGQATATVSVLNPDGNSSEGLSFRLGQPPPPPPGATVTISAGGVVEGAGFQKAPYPVSGGGIVSVFGTFTGAAQQQATGFPLLMTLGNTTVTFNGTPAPLLFTSTGQINLVAPTSLLGATTAQVVVTAAGQPSAMVTVNVAAAAPGIFIIDPGNNAGAFEHANGSIISDANPARRGETIIMFLTGLGATTPPAADGQPASFTTLSNTVVTPVVTVSGTPARVRFSGLTPGYSGLYQINFDIPAAAPSGSAAVTVSAAGLASNSVRLAMEP